MATATININIGEGKNISVELEKAHAAADTVVNRLFFLQDTFEALSNPNYDEITFSPYGLYGFYEILKDIVEKASDVTEILSNVQGR